MIGQFFAEASLFVGGLVLIAAMVGAREIGAYARRVANRRHKSAPTTENDANVLLSVALGLLSLLLGFAFSIALSRYDDRRELVASEASAIATASQRIGLLDNPARDELMREIRQYTAVRVSAGMAVNEKRRRSLDRRSDKLSIRLVKSTVKAALPLRGTSTATVVLDGVDRALDLADRRRATAEAKLPSIVVGTLVTYCVVVAGLFGYALTSTASRNRIVSYLLFALFASVVSMILDLDRPRGGAITVGQEPMKAVYQKLVS